MNKLSFYSMKAGKIMVIIFSCLTVFNASAQIIGPTSVSFGDTATYIEYLEAHPDSLDYRWEAVGGQLVSYTETEAVVIWNIANASQTVVNKLDPNNDYSIMDDLAVTVNIPVIQYAYDSTGNRTERNVVILVVGQLKSAKADKNFQKEYKETLEEVTIKIFPNPTDGKLTITIEELDPTLRSGISVYTMNGRLISKTNHLDYTNIVDLSDQPGGIYILLISCNNKVSQWKIIKR